MKHVCMSENIRFSYFIPANYLYNIDVFTWHMSRNESFPFFYLSPKLWLCVERENALNSCKLTFRLKLQFTIYLFFVFKITAKFEAGWEGAELYSLIVDLNIRSERALGLQGCFWFVFPIYAWNLIRIIELAGIIVFRCR